MRLYVDLDVDPSGNTCYVENLGHVVMLTLEEYKKELEKEQAEKKKKLDGQPGQAGSSKVVELIGNPSGQSGQSEQHHATDQNLGSAVNMEGKDENTAGIVDQQPEGDSKESVDGKAAKKRKRSGSESFSKVAKNK